MVIFAAVFSLHYRSLIVLCISIGHLFEKKHRDEYKNLGKNICGVHLLIPINNKEGAGETSACG